MATLQSKTLGRLLKDARIAAQLSIRQAASEADISKSLLDAWERDQVDSPELGKLLRLAAVLEIDPTAACEAAGYDLSGTLPSIKPYLRSKYPTLPASALQEIAEITEKYGIDPNHTGPRPGEDEQ
ncbi:helix-turn-helix domain-containing protein [Leekyejoonella antrihumi]|uniref:Helix-turn-helix transcriptional regulator n=1 Tax=Leekyejoonella antrihumi TaxID=1660198 RepID=A0A563DVU8_9MICO|nr:helix-turn-helix transcriptional regulator [Leekyejoonella antrihumi]TWP34337.1 helix-turn-helix transcriptional regulator [Leekyejoonella antrihumi]